MLRYFVPIAVVVLSLAYYQFFHAEKNANAPSQRAPVAEAASVESATASITSADQDSAVSATTLASVAPTAATPEAQALIKEEILRLAPRSSQFNGLPDGDREWVIEETVKFYSYGQIKMENLGDYIHELSSTRYHAVHEREHPMLTEENFAAAEGSGE